MEWQRFKTTRLYLQPPKSERIITLWRDGKVMLGEVEEPINKPYAEIAAAGVWFIDENGAPSDFKESSYELRDDGIPAHKLHMTLDKINVTLECVCDFKRCPLAYIKATVSAKNGAPVSTKFGFILRSGKESELIFSSPDVYAIYEPKISEWTNLRSDWSYDGVWRSGDYFLASDVSDRFDFNPETSEAYTKIELCRGEIKEFTIDSVRITP